MLYCISADYSALQWRGQLQHQKEYFGHSFIIIDFNTGSILCSVGIFTCNRDANAERMAEHCLESGCIGKYNPPLGSVLIQKYCWIYLVV